MWQKIGAAVAFGVVLSACGHVDEYERHVSDWEPVYCYKSLASTACYREPNHADARRLVNYFGPHPSRYDAPEPPEAVAPAAPEPVNYWVKDPEPLPRPMPKGDLADRPWLTDEGRAETADRVVMTKLERSDVGTQALLRRIADVGANPLDLPEPDMTVR